VQPDGSRGSDSRSRMGRAGVKRKKLYGWNWITFAIFLAAMGGFFYYVENVEFRTVGSWAYYVALGVATLFSIDERDAGPA
jgi:hypothetical protein